MIHPQLPLALRRTDHQARLRKHIMALRTAWARHDGSYEAGQVVCRAEWHVNSAVEDAICGVVGGTMPVVPMSRPAWRLGEDAGT